MVKTLLPELVLVEDTLEDELMSLRGISRSGIPCQITVRRDGAEAIELLFSTKSAPPDLVVLDFKLPKFSGLEILTQMRENPATRFVPVVIVSGTNSGKTLRECYRVGANSCVTKPVDMSEYVEHLAHVTRYWLTVNQAAN